VVTLEDLLEALVGEIADEDEAAAVAPPVAPDFLTLDGATPAGKVAEHFGITAPGGESTSFAGQLVERLGRIPQPGERFRFAGLDVDITAATAVRINAMVVRRGTPPAVLLDREGE
jgi:putative hemolysin